MQHAGADDGGQAQLVFRIGQFGAHNAVDVVGVADLALRLENNENVRVGQRGSDLF